jgi:hypothetical protein
VFPKGAAASNFLHAQLEAAPELFEAQQEQLEAVCPPPQDGEEAEEDTARDRFRKFFDVL